MVSEPIKVCLCVLKKENKSRYDTYSVKDVPLFIVLVISTHSSFRSGRVGLTPLTDNVYLKYINNNIWHLHSLSVDESQSYV